MTGHSATGGQPAVTRAKGRTRKKQSKSPAGDFHAKRNSGTKGADIRIHINMNNTLGVSAVEMTQNCKWEYKPKLAQDRHGKRLLRAPGSHWRTSYRFDVS
jgi:hypothetical protein